MKSEPFPMLTPLPRVGGEYVKLKTGELVKWESFSEATQTFEIKSPSGEIFEINRRDIEMPTSHEEIDFLKSRFAVSN
jgi:hypothetical protein